MPVNGLDAYLAERGLIQECKLAHLKDSRLGIDAQHWFKMLLDHPAHKEPFVSVTGGAPLIAYNRMEAELRELERSKIKPVFAFHGIPPARKDRPFAATISGVQPPPNATPDTAPLDLVWQHRLRLRDQGWDNYVRAQMDGAINLFGQSSSVEPEDILHQVYRLFRTRQVEYLIAPYLNWAQLVYLERHPKGYIHAICGGSELFMFEGVEKVILSINFEKGTFRYATKASILHDLGITPEVFLDSCILAGYGGEYGSPTFPIFAHQEFQFRHAPDLVRQHRGGFATLAAFNEYPSVGKSGYADQFCRSKCSIKYSLILVAEEGKVLPLPLALSGGIAPTSPSLTSNGHPSSSSNSSAIGTGTAVPSPALQHATPPSGSGLASSVMSGGASSTGTAGVISHHDQVTSAAEIPADLHEVFSNRFPDEVYFQLCRAMIGPTLLKVITSGTWIEPPPLCGGETEDYWTFVREALTESPTSPRCVALALVTGPLNQFWKKKPVSAVYYFDLMNHYSIPFQSTQTSNLLLVAWDWNVPAMLVEEELRRQNSSTIDISLCLGATSHATLAARTKTSRSKSGGSGRHRPLEKKDEVVANALWRFLALRGYLTGTHLHTPWGGALYHALQTAKVNDKLQEPLLVALELLRADRLHNGRFGGRAWVGTAHLGSEEDQRCMLLVMRVVSILPLQFKAMAWKGPLSRDLLVFNSFVRATGRALRLLVEATVLSLVLRNDARRSREDGMEVGLSLPFQADANTGMGILFKGYADMLLQERDERLSGSSTAAAVAEGGWGGMTRAELTEVKSDILESAQEGFPMVRDVGTELKRGFRFWDTVMRAVRSLNDSSMIAPPRAGEFERADRWLMPFRV